MPCRAMPCRFRRSLGIAVLSVDSQGQDRGCGGLESATQAGSLVLEATVLVLAEQRETDGGEGVGLEELETLFEGVVDFDLAGAVEDDDAAGSVWEIIC